MFKLFNITKTIDFMRWSKLAYAISIITIILALASITIKGLNWGLDFTGGSLVEIGFEQAADLNQVRETLHSNGFEDAVVQHYGSATEVLIRLRPRTEINSQALGDHIMSALKIKISQPIEMRRIEFVGPNVGGELADSAGLAIIASLLSILAYVSLRFQWRLAAGAVLSLGHDVIICIGIFSFFQIEIDLTIVAAILTVVGYSLNDTIVVFDRIRENFQKTRLNDPTEVINDSVTQTLSRTVITSGTTLFVVISLFMLGGSMIHGFALALLLGILFGTFSSIYVASAIALNLGLQREQLLPPAIPKNAREGYEEFEDYP